MPTHDETVFTLQPSRTPERSAGLAPGASILERNLAALSRSSRIVAERLRTQPASRSVEFVETGESGALSATLDGRALASKRRPLEEARRLASTVDIKEAAVFAVTGFGVGHHVAALAERLGRTGIILCFEPDLSLLRAVLERVDHSSWIAKTNIAFVAEPDDAATLSTIVQGMEGVVAMGVRIVEHPASAERLGATAQVFGETLSRVVSAVRTNVLTTMVQTSTTVRNLAMNADRYLASPGIEDLRGALEGRPGVVVSAGPSLSRNIRELARAGVRDRVCIIAVQTTLKPLLAAGVKPHFVVALDYHEISRRFYEGLTASDVEGVTLVVEPKANPAILDVWPGDVRMPRDSFLDTMLGAELADPNRGAIRSGATVAHLAHYLARHLGCDPVALVGQDLGFTDGQYYAAGASIHEVWASDLNEFVSLELLEWQRVVRNRSILRRAVDVLGRPIYTDEQMATYLAQFERDFLADAQAGLTTIDATEGGVRKAHTTPMTLRDFLDVHADSALPALPTPKSRMVESRLRESAIERLREVRQGVWRVARACRSTGTVLAQMLEHHRDQARVNQLIGQAQQIAEETRRIAPAYELVQKYNQAGIFNRAREDRAIALDDLDPYARQRRQIERDQRNIEWLGDAAESFGALLDSACTAIRTGERVTRDITPTGESSAERASRVSTSVAAVVVVDHETGSLGASRALGARINGKNALARTVERLGRCSRLDAIVLLTSDADRTRALLEGVPVRTPVHLVASGERAGASKRIRAARAWASASWRAGIAGMTVFDELVDPGIAARALEQVGAKAALLVGADWALVDPALCDSVIERHAESPTNHRLVFTQAAPGLCGCVIDLGLLREIAEGQSKGGAMASIGGLLAYNPRKPRADAIAKPICVTVDPAVRDLQRRCIADSANGVALCERYCDDAIDAATLARRIESDSLIGVPSELTLRVDDSTSPEMVAKHVAQMDFAFAITLDASSLVETDRLGALVRSARNAGAKYVHVRVELRKGEEDAASVLGSAPDVVSVEMHADSSETFQAATGRDGYALSLRALEALANMTRERPFDEQMWIVPRLTKRDAVYGDIESFVDKWMLVFGHAAIDAFDDAPADERIQPLPAPQSAKARFERDRVVVDLRRSASR
jgi:spore coat polysaccharide biosynthesis protein SpsF (cytidylyltransferase family)